MSSGHFFQRNKCVYEFSLPHKYPFPWIEAPSLRQLPRQTIHDLLPAFPITIEHKILVDEVRDGKIDEYAFPDGCLSDLCEDENLK